MTVDAQRWAVRDYDDMRLERQTIDSLILFKPPPCQASTYNESPAFPTLANQRLVGMDERWQRREVFPSVSNQHCCCIHSIICLLSWLEHLRSEGPCQNRADHRMPHKHRVNRSAPRSQRRHSTSSMPPLRRRRHAGLSRRASLSYVTHSHHAHALIRLLTATPQILTVQRPIQRPLLITLCFPQQTVTMTNLSVATVTILGRLIFHLCPGPTSSNAIKVKICGNGHCHLPSSARRPPGFPYHTMSTNHARCR
jgi:hypothetical protein